jgi:hypothetical protein
MTGPVTQTEHAGNGSSNGRARKRVDVRRENRVACGKPVDILPCSRMHERSWELVHARVTNCSTNGLGMVLDLPIPAGEQFLIRLSVDGKVCLFIYTVRHCTPAAGSGERDRYHIGAELDRSAASRIFQTDSDALLRLLVG